MRPKVYQLLEMCVEYGVERGYNRAHKHNDNPSEAAIKESIHNCVMGEICDWFDFDGGTSCGNETNENKSW